MKKILIALLLPCALLAQTKPRNPIAPSGSWVDGLVRAYLFSWQDSVKADSVQDWSSNNVWGIIVNAGSWTSATDGVHTPVWTLSGSNDYMQAGSVSGFAITDSLSIFGVFNDVNSGSGNEPLAFVNRSLTPEQTLRFRDDDGAHPFDWQFGVYTSSMIECTVDSIVVDGGSPHTAFFSMLGIYDGVNVSGYRDGILQSQSAQTGDIILGNRNFEIGRSSNGSGLFSFWTNGIVSAVYLWNRVLTTEEIAALAADPYIMFREPVASGRKRKKPIWWSEYHEKDFIDWLLALR